MTAADPVSPVPHAAPALRLLRWLLACVVWIGVSAYAQAQSIPVPSLSPNRVTLETDATGVLTLKLNATATTTQTFVVSNPRPDLVQAPSRVSIPAGGASVTVPVKGLAAGTVNLRIASNARALDATVEVLPGNAALTSIEPAPTTVSIDGIATLRLELSAVLRVEGAVALAVEPPDAVEVPATVNVAAGASSVSVPVRGLRAGLHTLRATFRGQTLSAPLRVTEAAAALVAIEPDRAEGEVGTTMAFTVRLNRISGTPTDVLLSATSTAVLEVPPTITIPAGTDRATVSVRLKEAGSSAMRAQLGESVAETQITVRNAAGGGVPPALTVRPGLLALTVGGTGQVVLEVDAARSYDMPFALSIVSQVPAGGSGAVLSFPASVVVLSGQRSVTFRVQGLQAGTARVGVKPTNAPVVPALDVTVSADVPAVVGLTPGPQPIAKGSVGVATVTIAPGAAGASTVGVTSDAPDVVSVPPEVVVPAGVTTTSVPLSARSEGTAQISATMGGRTASAQVLVGTPVAEDLKVPSSLAVAVAASERISVQALLTDGQQLPDPQGLSWTSANPAVATVDATGLVTGISAGSTTVQVALGALKAVVNVTVSQLPLLGLTPANAQGVVGTPLTYTVTTQTPAAAGGLTVRLSASGTGAAQFPATVTIPAGGSGVSFTLLPSGAGALLLRAEADGRQAATAQLTIVAPVLAITGATPLTGPAGTVITISGTGFDTVAANNTVRIGSVVIEVTSATATQIVGRVPIQAVTGVISVTNALGTATGPTFTVPQAQDADLQATPNALRLLRGSEAASSLAIVSTGTQTYTGSFNLSVSGLPTGVTAVLDPLTLPAGRSGLVRFTANGSVSPGTYAVIVTGAGYSTAGNITRSATLTVTVPDPQVTPSTGVRGRFVTPEGKPIAGVIVRADYGNQNSPSTTTDAAGSFELAGLQAGALTLRFDATPANPLYPIWPFSVTVIADQMIVLKDFVIAPPPEAPTFTPINNATQDQKITDARFPGLEITLPAGAEIVGWDGVKKTQIAVEKREISELPVVPPPVPTGGAFQLYFGTPMGGIPSQPIPISLPNDTGAEPGDTVNVWFFDGSPLGGSGEWKVAGQAVVSADGKVAKMVSGGLTRFCGVCGLACLQSPPKGDQPSKGDPNPCAGNPVNLYSGQELTRTGGLSCSGLVPVETGRNYNPIDAFGNIGGTEGSVGYGWTLDYDIMFLGGSTKRLVLAGNVDHIFVDDGAGGYRNRDEPKLDGAIAADVGGLWQITFRDGTLWKFQPFPGAPGNVRGQPQFLVEVRSPNGRVMTVGRNTRGQLMSVGSAERRITASYGTSGFIETLSDPEGRTERFTYTASKRIETVTDPDGRITRYSYVSDNDLPKDPVCNFAFRPDVGERIKTVQYPGLTNPTENTYGSSRRILKQSTATNLEYRYSYKVGGACITNVAQPGVICSGANCPTDDSLENFQAGWRFHGGQVLATTVLRPDGTTAMWRFGSQGQVLESSHSSGVRAVFTRDSLNRVIAITDTIGRTNRLTYDDKGNVIRLLDPIGRITELEYDARWSKPTAITRYEDSGTPRVWRFGYDGKGNAESITDPLNNTTRMGYSAVGQLTSVTDALQFTTAFEYDLEGDLAKVIDPLRNETLFDADRSGRLNASTDALGYSTTWSTNGIGQTTDVLDAVGGKTRIRYDEGARLKSVTDPRDIAIASYEYDLSGRLRAEIDAANLATTYQYDSAGRIERIQDRAGQVTRVFYDDAGRMQRLDFSDRTRTLTYDAVGRLSRVEEGASRFDFEYDGVDRLVKEVQTYEARTHEITYSYDRIGRRISRKVNGGNETRYEWDAADRLIAIHFAGGVTRYEWDAAGRLKRKTLPNAITADYAFDGAGRLLEIAYHSGNGTPIEKVSYSYDLRGKRVSKDLARGTVARDSAMVAGYDDAGRMTSVEFPSLGLACTLQYDNNGNLRRKDCGTGGVTDYSWDALNRLVEIRQPDLSARYRYDISGRRVLRMIQDETTNYVYDGHQVVAEVSGTEVRNFVSGLALDEAIAVYGQRGSRFAITDALGSMLAEADETGSVSTEASYSPYGTTELSGDAPLGSARYAGRELDRTGLYFNRARYYDPHLKRFISEDPIGLRGGLNSYAYGASDPITNRDPLGLLSDPTGVYTKVLPRVGAAFAADVAVPEPSDVAWPKWLGWAATLAAAGVYDWVMSESSPPTPSDPALQQEIEREANRREYKNRCSEPPPPDLVDPCERAIWNLRKARDCKALRDANTNRWHEGIDDRHSPQLATDLDRQISNAEKAVERLCRCKPQ